MSQTITVNLGAASYPVHVMAGALAHAANWIAPHAPRGRVFIVEDCGASVHWGDMLKNGLVRDGLEAEYISLPGGEQVKDWASLQSVCEGFLAAGIQRGDCVVGFGGGAVGDLAGLSAALIHRGVTLIQIPTTLLSQVDSSVGGKTAINARPGKNLVGAFHQPRLVITDPDLLTTLDARERAAGWAEIIKIGMMTDQGLLDIMHQADDLASLRGASLTPVIARAIAAKARVVEADEKEKGQRALLNFGHTFGHALEAHAMDRGDVLHGEAVAVGMMMAARFAAAHHDAPTSIADELEGLLGRARAPRRLAELDMPRASADALLAHMAHDKKNAGDGLTLILPRTRGEGRIITEEAGGRLLAFLQNEVEAA